MHSFIISTFDPPDSPDTLKILPETSIGIEQIRQIQHFLSKKPIQSSHNTVIIYDAHLLTLPAQNALLKVLEEPPGNSLIYLVTSSPDTLLPTVLSRCEIISSATPSPTINPEYQKLFQELLATTGVGERMTLLESQALTREQALKFLKDVEYLLHQFVNNSPLRPPLNLRGGSEGALYQLITQVRQYLRANCSLKLCLDNLAINLLI